MDGLDPGIALLRRRLHRRLIFNVLILGSLIHSKTSTYGTLGTAATLLLAFFFIGRAIVGAAVLQCRTVRAPLARARTADGSGQPSDRLRGCASVRMTSVAESPRRPLWRRLLRPMLMVAGLVVVFAWVLPQFIDYDHVWSALKQLDAWELVALVVLALARVPTEALMYRAFLPGLRLMRGSEAYLSSNLAGQLLPPPSASVIQYGYFRGGGYEADAARSQRSDRLSSRRSAGSCSRSSR